MGSARRALEKTLPETLCYTSEASFFHDIAGFSQADASGQHEQATQGAVNTEKGYIRMGEQLGRALSHYYRSLERF